MYIHLISVSPPLLWSGRPGFSLVGLAFAFWLLALAFGLDFGWAGSAFCFFCGFGFGLGLVASRFALFNHFPYSGLVVAQCARSGLYPLIGSLFFLYSVLSLPLVACFGPCLLIAWLLLGPAWLLSALVAPPLPRWQLLLLASFFCILSGAMTRLVLVPFI